MNPKHVRNPDAAQLSLGLIMNVQFAKWTSRQINVVKEKFKKGLTKPTQTALTFADLPLVFPGLKYLSPVNVRTSGRISIQAPSICLIRTILKTLTSKSFATP